MRVQFNRDLTTEIPWCARGHENDFKMNLGEPILKLDSTPEHQKLILEALDLQPCAHFLGSSEPHEASHDAAALNNRSSTGSGP
jgi:hypothetical protein